MVNNGELWFTMVDNTIVSMYAAIYGNMDPININERERYIYISTIKLINPRTIVVINISMAISGSQNSGTVPYTAIFWGIFPEIKA